MKFVFNHIYFLEILVITFKLSTKPDRNQYFSVIKCIGREVPKTDFIKERLLT
jgi:hypothetical protein